MAGTDAKAHKRAYDRARYARLRAEAVSKRPPDPITLISDLDAAYLAGLIDGEGSLYVGAVGPKRDRTCYPLFAIGMTDQGVIEWVAEKFNVTISYVLKNGGRNKPQFFVRLSGKRVQILCRRLAPFLRVKARQALLITTFPADARVAPGVKVERSAINIERERLRIEINGLNHAPRNKSARRSA
jgi:hypothetical protein